VVFQDEIEEGESSKQTQQQPQQQQFPLKIEWPSRRSFGFDDDDSDERPDSGVGESVRKFSLALRIFMQQFTVIAE
jgi:hypothetical protein